MSHGITIGALAKRTQCQAETIRYYEREGLLPPPARSQGNYRQYETPCTSSGCPSFGTAARST